MTRSALDDSDLLPLLGPREYQAEKDKARKLRDTPWWRKKKADGICHYCRRKFSPAVLTMDHVIPLSRGGRSTRENLVPCCKDCNNRKKNLVPVEWAEYLESLGKTPT